MKKKTLVKKPTKKIATTRTDKDLDALYQRVSGYLHSARSNILKAIDTEMVKAYWLVGRDIVEEEQHGKARANYGTSLIQELSERLTKEFGKGFSEPNVKNIRQFYLIYQKKGNSSIRYALRSESKPPKFDPNLSWTHYRSLMRVSRPEARLFYEVEASKNRWSSRELERQIHSLLFDRLAKSRDKAGLMRLVKNGHEINNPSDAIKEPLVLEFLGIPEAHQISETELEQALIDNLQHFLLELGTGFAFVARQKRLTLDGKHYFADLVFYHTVLKCFIILDLKNRALNHGDLGQMLLYVNYFDRECLSKGDNPTIGLVLCTERSDMMANYLLGDKAKQIFSTKYQLHLPTEKELTDELKREIKQIEHRLKQSDDD